MPMRTIVARLRHNDPGCSTTYVHGINSTRSLLTPALTPPSTFGFSAYVENTIHLRESSRLGGVSELMAANHMGWHSWSKKTPGKYSRRDQQTLSGTPSSMRDRAAACARYLGFSEISSLASRLYAVHDPTSPAGQYDFCDAKAFLEALLLFQKLLGHTNRNLLDLGYKGVMRLLPSHIPRCLHPHQLTTRHEGLADDAVPGVERGASDTLQGQVVPRVCPRFFDTGAPEVHFSSESQIKWPGFFCPGITSLLIMSPCRITTQPPETVYCNQPITPEITASFTVAEYQGDLNFDDYTKFLANVSLYTDYNMETPVESLAMASPNDWTTNEAVHFSFPQAAVPNPGSYYLQVTVYYPTEIDYENVGVVYSGALTAF
ncbi:hypothetical protein QBC40DRAFT_300658 [Triangularia verruculosa]|uniref:Uncharacterized protein n=1 Tax=Triangularia verruculosa TaxID=2587418 RepID=A0AAN6XCF0_9PEZI|nr:hypothetical protein QBC40DRAFT_300658 [Triangularia verruculosa]